MGDSRWIETKKVYEVSDRGDLKPKKVTLELEKEKQGPWKFGPKEWIDYLFHLVGLFAIAIPLWLFNQGQQEERKKQRALLQVDIYTKASTELASLSNLYEEHE